MPGLEVEFVLREEDGQSFCLYLTAGYCESRFDEVRELDTFFYWRDEGVSLDCVAKLAGKAEERRLQLCLPQRWLRLDRAIACLFSCLRNVRSRLCSSC